MRKAAFDVGLTSSNNRSNCKGIPLNQERLNMAKNSAGMYKLQKMVGDEGVFGRYELNEEETYTLRVWSAGSVAV